jgi:hypothetical protein
VNAPAWDPELDLPAGVTLRLYVGGGVVFESGGRWLHPLFELEEHLARTGLDPAGARLVDRITGRAAAFLVVRMGIRILDTRLLSDRAVPLLDAHGVRWRCAERVERVLCRTEDLLADVRDPDAAWTLLQARRARSQVRE